MACSGGRGAPLEPLPEFAVPRGRLVDDANEPGRDLIAYRRLEPGDFRGAEPPPQHASHRDKLGAATCVYVLVLPETKIRLVAVRSPQGPVRYRAEPTALGFRALMDRDCSWWNSEQRHPPGYVLEHEQIHFALFELEARRLDTRSPEIASAVTVGAATPEEAVRGAQERLAAEVRQAMAVAVQRNREFDEDTSMGVRPERQQTWRDRVRAELARTELEATGHPP